MSDSNDGCIVGLGLVVITIAFSIGSGMLAWNWIEPDSFWGAIAFLIAWGIFTKIGYMIGMLIVAGLSSLFD